MALIHSQPTTIPPRAGWRLVGIRTAPAGGSAPKAGCVASDTFSGVASCRFASYTTGRITHYQATATDRASNITVTDSYRILKLGSTGRNLHRD